MITGFRLRYGDRCLKISGLEGKRVAIWGYGREGRAALAAMRWRLPSQPVTVFCNEAEAATLRAMEDPALEIDTGPVDGRRLSTFEVVIKSPGHQPLHLARGRCAVERHAVHRRHRAVVRRESGRAHGLRHRHQGQEHGHRAIAHLLRSAGRRTALAGNIGLPLLELLDVDPPPQYWAIELSSYQAREAIRPEVAVVLNFFPEHLDWHGTEAALFRRQAGAGHAGSAARGGVQRSRPEARCARRAGNHRGALVQPRRRLARARPRAVARIAAGDGCAQPAAAGSAQSRESVRRARRDRGAGPERDGIGAECRFLRPLPHRLQSLGSRDGIEFVDDSISTTPHASLAALDCHRGRRVAILVGGYDRGVDWGVFAERMAVEPPVAVITMGQNGPRIHEKLKQIGINNRFRGGGGGRDGRRDPHRAAQLLENNGLILLSPGAPSFPRYKDYAERGRHFAKVAGFDPKASSRFPASACLRHCRR
jgi:UDP-N-acetylmuramoylalanine--D-glutamate ligase